MKINVIDNEAQAIRRTFYLRQIHKQASLSDFRTFLLETIQHQKRGWEASTTLTFPPTPLQYPSASHLLFSTK